MLSAKDGIDDRVALLNEGADDYLCKPFDLKELKELMFRELDLLSRHLYDTTIVRLIIDTAVMAERAVCGFFMPETPSVMPETPYGKSSEEGALSTGRHFLEELGSRFLFPFPHQNMSIFSGSSKMIFIM